MSARLGYPSCLSSFFAISLRCSAVSFLALATPPFSQVVFLMPIYLIALSLLVKWNLLNPFVIHFLISFLGGRKVCNYKIGILWMVCSRAEPTEMRLAGQEVSSSSLVTYWRASDGNCSYWRISVVGACQPGNSS